MSKTVLITGGSRGIGQAINVKFTEAGANVAILDKNTQPLSDKRILALDVDLTNMDAIKSAIEKVEKQFGGIDIVVNNVTAFCFKNSADITEKEFDHLIALSGKATFFVTQACLPYLKKSSNPHVINIAPPLQHIDPEWFVNHTAFSLAKYTMSLCTMGFAAELKHDCIAVNALWPCTTIATSTITDNFTHPVYQGSRWPSIMADAAYELASRKSRECTGNFFIDENLLREIGITDFAQYAVDPKAKLIQDLFVPPSSHYPMTPITKELYIPEK